MDTISNNIQLIEQNLQQTNVNRVYARYKIPLPLELFQFLKEKAIFNEKILTPLTLKDRFLTEIQKALALGIYNADLAYCTVLEQNQVAINYFVVSKEIAQELSIEEGYSEQIYNRLVNNIQNIDSIRKITDEAYWKACNFLEENNRYNVLPFVVVGGWFESLYLIIHSQGPNIPSGEIEAILVKQKQNFENVKKFLYDAQLETTAYIYNKELKFLTQQIQQIINLLNQYEAQPNKRQQIYQQIVNKIIHLRNLFLTNKPLSYDKQK